MKAQRGNRGIVLLFDAGTRWGWVFNAKPAALSPNKGPGTLCTGDWVGPRSGFYFILNSVRAVVLNDCNIN
jgi:hypothetical protein